MNDRVIKFRVWDKSSKKFLNSGETIEKYYLTFDGKVCVSIPDLQGGEIMGEVCEPVVQQFTGLFDKNGKEIFEGDIVKFMGRWGEKGGVLPPDYLPYQIIWFMGGLRAALINRPNPASSILKRNEMMCVGHTNCEIVGNIFENPELLQKQ